MDLETKRQREQQVVGQMIRLYCQKKHGTQKGALCPDCAALEWDKTVVLVSHRQSTMGIADRVYSVENGRMS